MSIVAGEKCNDFVFHRSEGGSDGTKQHPYSRLNITHMSRERIQPSIGIQESSPSVPMDVRPEIWIGQELRRIGDDFNSHFQTGRLPQIRSQNAHNHPGQSSPLD
ncbi:uncharacterized protein LOC119967070 isoform X7 [Scyliorhinus canicula]|uniref:uncharacterized protein LOC119967070 isoform X7 n=1 Tax=Scyliorhinus canicula TaxID=7830 RepID=UPI0018F604E1|nr:uncharacterized protein LOC119967070 isoform X7 [Scyliorhinus canicula]